MGVTAHQDDRLARFSFNPLTLFAAAASQYGGGVLGPGQLVADPLDAVSLGLSLMLGTAGLPHILMRFYTVPDAKTARESATYATAFIGFFYLLTFILGFGAMVLVGQEAIRAVDPGGNMAAPLLAEVVGGTPFLGFIAAVAFATILVVVAGSPCPEPPPSHTISGCTSSATGRPTSANSSSWLAHPRSSSARSPSCSVFSFRGQNVAFMVGLAFAIAASANFPALVLAMFWRRFTTRGAQASMLVGTFSALLLIYLSPTIQIGVLGGSTALFPLSNPGLISIPLSFAVGIAVSLLSPKPAAAAGFEQLEHRLHLGEPTTPA